MQALTLDKRMKFYEGVEAGRRLLPGLPVLARMDGRCFHTFTRGLARPYDGRMTELMTRVTGELVRETGACIGYTQSDEISLVFYRKDWSSQIFFDGRVMKMTSVLAALTTALFHRHLPDYLPEKREALPLFDARVWSVPSREEAVNALLWRELDATRNSVSMAAQAYYPQAELAHRSSKEMQEMLFQKGVNWNDYPAFFKRGTYLQRHTVSHTFSTTERDALPPLHQARTNPALQVERTEIVRLEMPPLARVTNPLEVVFEGADPEPASLQGYLSQNDP